MWEIKSRENYKQVSKFLHFSYTLNLTKWYNSYVYITVQGFVTVGVDKGF